MNCDRLRHKVQTDWAWDYSIGDGCRDSNAAVGLLLHQLSRKFSNHQLPQLFLITPTTAQHSDICQQLAREGFAVCDDVMLNAAARETIQFALVIVIHTKQKAARWTIQLVMIILILNTQPLVGRFNL